ncbi:hypothetical protein [Streptomyces longisporoflavus]|uniref:hypothetical protein n=1 Tax=Streptomyces longisporoflavus TaxID=28044 RepID=UPI001E48C71F|nr:hypothetical protein [Streptomyces longisporoflavus]
MRDVRRRTWLLVAGGTALALAVGGTGIAVSRSGERDARAAANQEQLARGCKGLFPGELRSFVPDDSAGVLTEYGTMLAPRQQSRALLDCTLSWGGGADRVEPDAQVRVRAEAVLGRTDAPDGGFGLPLPSSALGGGGAEDRRDGSEVSATILAECPKGLSGRVRPSEDLRVFVALPSRADSEYDVSEADRLLAERTAVRVADRVSREQGCGARPLTGAAKPKGSDSLCDWLSPEALEFARGDWKFYGNDTTYSERAGSCGGRWDGAGGRAAWPKTAAAGVDSWSGVLAPSAYDDFAGDGDVPGSDRRRHKPDGEGRLTVKKSGDDPLLALWARSVCDGGPAFHRATVMPALDFADQDELLLEKKDRRRMSADARALLDRYLAADDGWARRAHCRDTKIMGEVEEWQG